MPIVFSPLFSYPSIVLTTGPALRSSVNIVRALDRPCSKFELESRARPTAFGECNGSPSKDRTVPRKENDKETNGERENDRGRGGGEKGGAGSERETKVKGQRGLVKLV